MKSLRQMIKIKRNLSLFLVLFSVGFSYAQKAVTGRITLPDNSPAIGASVTEKGINNATITDVEGEFSLNVSSDDAVLVVSYIGFKNIEVKLDGQSRINTQFSDEGTLLEDVVVTASRSAMRKLVAPATVETVNAKKLETLKPESYNEALQNVPGVFVNPNQGRRNNIRLRGFPDGTPLGGMAYTAVLLDGIPTLATPGKLPENGFGFDNNIERVELVKGSAATLFGRGAAAGVINMITKTGGSKLGGSVRLTNYNDILDKGGFNYRADFNLNGPISENIRFNIGGWKLNDTGFRNTGYNDDGFQLRGNVDFLFPSNKGSLRVYGQYADFNFQNLADVAVDANTLKLAPGWKNTDTYNFPNASKINYRIMVRNAKNPATQVSLKDDKGNEIIRNFGTALDGGSYAKGFHAGARIRYDIGSGFEVENHIRYQDMETGTKYGFALPAYYNANNVSRLLLDGDNADKEIINDFKISKTIEGGSMTHKFSAGAYYSSINLLPTTYSLAHGSNTKPDSLRLQGAFTGVPVALGTDGNFAIQNGGITRRGDYTERVMAFYAGDEIKIGDKLNVLLGFRYDDLNIDMTETKFPADSALTRVEKFSDWSGTIGANYQLTESSAIYGNFNRAFRMPDYTAFTSLEWTSATNRTLLRAPNGINKNEIIYNTEIGYRNTFGDLSLDFALFHTQINNRLAAIFENGILVSKPLGSNRIMGSEISLSYKPSMVKGLSLNTSLTYQNARFTDFKISTTADPAKDLFGNKIIQESATVKSLDLKDKKLPGVPEFMFNFVAEYSHKYFGADFGYNIVTNRYQDATNILELPSLANINAGIYGNIKISSNTLKVGVLARNLTNAEALVNIAGASDNDTFLLRKQGVAAQQGVYAHGYMQLPRRILFYASYTF
ncbi:MAG: TonB-dependent receptor [Saprospiraceae bacterium]|nr:TonB-dependent receptor [Saprospiraceae bacterium]